MADRVRVFHDLATFITENEIPVRMVCIDTAAHQAKYAYPIPEYSLGLMLILERFAEYLDSVNDLGLVFGDYEENEVAKAVVDFSEYKRMGKTPMYLGRPLGRLVDTVYFTHSHHSRFLQVADLLVYMAGRYETGTISSTKWHETQVRAAWEKIKANVDVKIQRWP